jgi:hypothetical protein
MPTTFETVADRPGFRLGLSGPLVVGVYGSAVDTEALKLLDRHQTIMLSKYNKLFTFSIIAGEGLKAPPKEVREHSAALQQKFGPRCTGAAVVIVAQGLSAVVARGFMGALTLIAPPVMNQKVFKNVNDAIAWARSIPGQVSEVESPDLLEAIERFVKNG